MGFLTCKVFGKEDSNGQSVTMTEEDPEKFSKILVENYIYKLRPQQVFSILFKHTCYTLCAAKQKSLHLCKWCRMEALAREFCSLPSFLSPIGLII